jgi:hypothetical protein
MIPLRQIGSVQIDLYGAANGVFDLGAGGVTPRAIIAQADLRTNATYEVGLQLNKYSAVGDNFAAACTGLDFANQPAGDEIEVLSSSTADVTQTVTVYGTIQGTSVVVARTVALNGQSVVASTLGSPYFGTILGVELSAVCVGTITVQEASANADIITIAPAALSSGVTDVAATSQKSYGMPFAAFGSGATTKVVGVVGQDSLGNTIYDAITLAGATVTRGAKKMAKVTKLLYGDLESSRTATFEVGGLTIGTSDAILTDGGALDTTNQTSVMAIPRYLHWCFVNGTTEATGGVADRLQVELYG